MNRVSFLKITLIAVVVILVAGAGIFFYKKAEPQEIIPEVTSAEIESAGLASDAYVVPRTNFAVHLPVGWQIDESGSLGTYTVFINPVSDGDGTGIFNASIAITRENGNYLEDLARKTRAAMPEQLENYIQTDNRRVQLGVLEGHIVGGTFTYEGLALKMIRLVTYDNVSGQGYAVTATMLNSAAEKYAKTIETFFRTFRPMD